jgi:hypothetical protein
MTEIKLQFVREKAFSSELIAWFSSGHLSHVDYVLDNGKLLGARSDIINNIDAGVQIRPANYSKWIICKIMKVPCTEEQKLAFEKFLYAQIGKPYDKLAIFAFIVNRNWREPDSWICSELQSRAGEYSNILNPLYLAANKITPVSCALAFSAVGGKI